MEQHSLPVLHMEDVDAVTLGRAQQGVREEVAWYN